MPLSLKWKVLIGLGILAVIATLLLIIKYQHDLITKQKEIESSLVEMKKLPDNITRAQSQYVTKKDLEEHSKKLDVNLKPIKDDLAALGADIKGISSVKVVTVGYKGSQLPSNTSIPRTDPPKDNVNLDPWGYQKSTQVLKLNEPFVDKPVPWGEVKFSAWQKEPWDLSIHPRTYSVVNVLGQDEDGRHYVYSKFSVETGGKKYDVGISDNKFVEEYPESKLRMWNPKIMIGSNFGNSVDLEWNVSPGLYFSFINFGRTKKDLDFMFFNSGIAYNILNDRINFIISPIMLKAPLFNNTFIGPSVGLDSSKDFILLCTIFINM